MKRIAIIGSSGSGKSTLARSIGKILHIEVYHLDQLFWKPGWVLATLEEQKRIQHEITSQEHWIIDGTYSSTMDIRLKHADTIIFLDLPRLLCVYRVVKRRIHYRNRTRPDMGEDCEEKLDWEFLSYVWNFPKTNKPKIENYLLHRRANQEVIVLSSLKEIRIFLDKIRKTVQNR
ncbi:DNA topology modulation protein [Virgibacillus sp. MSP4-1]|uniref:DNA topology modulation protein n=1 Tax=Virgibacillus sp. MSP4-1 TaxID=2700081 RepID=UPI0003A71498|nr:DNA topology modulation protein [Virgibacillus sp. MSP4-1]QHS21755.1 DNA topology modulation protein [Virgibacillus sp. MSP4-1]